LEREEEDRCSGKVLGCVHACDRSGYVSREDATQATCIDRVVSSLLKMPKEHRENSQHLVGRLTHFKQGGSEWIRRWAAAVYCIRY